MGSIRLLGDHLASQVAAGEVVERPASVLKELVENAIDAGAQCIDVSFERGGVKLIKVVDDGSGMDRSDALLSLERHATSKIQTFDDLSSLGTFGFRGEAIPSIASVSRFQMSTCLRSEASSLGVNIVVEGGKFISVNERALPQGTTIEVRELFFNVPARRKFLKSEAREAAYLLEQLQILALAHPRIAFTCRRDHQEVFRLASTDSLAIRLRDLYGIAFLKKMSEVPPMDVEGVRVYGFLARPGEGRSDRLQQLFFINGRMIRSPFLSQVLRGGCDGLLPKGLHPMAMLFFQLDPASFDCNVHPAKCEVRFQEPHKVKAAALRAVATVMGTMGTNFQVLGKPSFQRVTLPSPSVDSPSFLMSEISSQLLEESPSWIQERNEELLKGRLTSSQERKIYLEKQSSLPVLGESSYSYVGSVAEDYFIIEEGDGFILVRIAAALERINYEQWKRSLSTGLIESQQLLLPAIIDVSPAELASFVAHEALLRRVGLEMEPFAPATVAAAPSSLKVDALPRVLHDFPIEKLIHELLHDLQEKEFSVNEAPESLKIADEALARSISRLISATRRIPTDQREAMMILEELLRCEFPYTTPSGKPTMVQFSASELQRKFC